MKGFRSALKNFFSDRPRVIFLIVCMSFFLLGARLFSLQIINGASYEKSAAESVTRTLELPSSRGNIYDRNGVLLAGNLPSFQVVLKDTEEGTFSDKTEKTLELFRILKEKNLIEDTLPVTEKPPYRYTLRADDVSLWLSEKGLPEGLTAEKLMNRVSSLGEAAGLSPEDARRFFALNSTVTDKNLSFLFLTMLMYDAEAEIPDSLPVEEGEKGYEFIFSGERETKNRLKNDLGFSGEELNMSADEVRAYLEELFQIPDCLERGLKTDLLRLRYAVYMKRYRKYEGALIIENADETLVAKIEERRDLYPNAEIQVSSKRYYPKGECFSHVLGYMGRISDAEYQKYKSLGYESTDIVGKTGIEKAFEPNLSGKDGSSRAKVDVNGRAVEITPAVKSTDGENIYLTLDASLQEKAYNSLENTLLSVLISKTERGEISVRDFLVSLLGCGNVDCGKLLADNDPLSFEIRKRLGNPDDESLLEEALFNAFEKGEITQREILELLFNQGRFTADEQFRDKIKSGKISVKSVLLQLMRERQILPKDTNLDPCQGSVFAADANTGEVLICVSYPAYDNNLLTNDKGGKYYESLAKMKSSPLINRALNQKKAPGSTLKPITAMAALEEGFLRPAEKITDRGVFTRAGRPYANCWIYTDFNETHGGINVSRALEVSCNYFFYETAYRMDGSSNSGIKTLNDYMKKFGLDSATGVEIGETEPNMASPQYKKKAILAANPESTSAQYAWSKGDTIRAAIGQSFNAFTPAQMTRYMAALATGERHSFSMVLRREDGDGKVLDQHLPEKEEILEFNSENLQAVKQGMYLVGKGSMGTLRRIFSDFPVDIGVKSGTAQENLRRSSHVWCVGFAPFDKPQIALTVMIPYGDYKSSPAAVVERDVLTEYFSLSQ